MTVNKPYDKIEILGTRIDAIDMPTAMNAIAALCAKKNSGYVCATNVHTLITAHVDESFQQVINQSDLSLADGMPVVWIARKLGIPLADRVYGPELMLSVCEQSLQNGLSHFFYGATADTLRRLEHALRQRFVGIRIAGSYAPPFRPLTEHEEQHAMKTIQDSQADIIWVGLGAPKQEYWMAEHRQKITAVQIGVGAAFDFISGCKSQAPKWMQKRGLEWLYRLLSEPARLWKRYLLYNPLYLYHVTIRKKYRRIHQK